MKRFRIVYERIVGDASTLMHHLKTFDKIVTARGGIDAEQKLMEMHPDATIRNTIELSK